MKVGDLAGELPLALRALEEHGSLPAVEQDDGRRAAIGQVDQKALASPFRHGETARESPTLSEVVPVEPKEFSRKHGTRRPHHRDVGLATGLGRFRWRTAFANRGFCQLFD